MFTELTTALVIRDGCAEGLIAWVQTFRSISRASFAPSALRSGYAASTFPAGASNAANTRLGFKHFLAGTLKTSQKASVYPGFQVYREIKPVEV